MLEADGGGEAEEERDADYELTTSQGEGGEEEVPEDIVRPLRRQGPKWVSMRLAQGRVPSLPL